MKTFLFICLLLLVCLFITSSFFYREDVDGINYLAPSWNQHIPEYCGKLIFSYSYFLELNCTANRRSCAAEKSACISPCFATCT